MRPLGRTLIGIAIFRAALGLIVLAVLQAKAPHAAYITVFAFVLAQLSDHVDGWIARRWSTPSLEGYLQDSVADKLFNVGCLLGLAVDHALIGVLIWGVLAREFVVMAIRVVVSDVETHLAVNKAWSVAYAALLRSAIFLLLALPLAPSSWPVRGLAGTAYVLVLAAVILGWTMAVSVLRSLASSARRR